MRTLDTVFAVRHVCEALGIDPVTFRQWRLRYAKSFEWKTGHQKYNPIDVCRMALAQAIVGTGVDHESAFWLVSKENPSPDTEKMHAVFADLCSGILPKRSVFCAFVRGGYLKLGSSPTDWVSGVRFVYADEFADLEAQAWSATDIFGDGLTHTFIQIDTVRVGRAVLARLMERDIFASSK